MDCAACGSPLETVERQLRAADEATQTTTSCPRCPVKAWKVNTTGAPRPSVKGFRFPIARPGRLSHKFTGTRQGQRYELIVAQSRVSNGAPPLSKCDVIVQKSVSYVASTSTGSRFARASVCVSGPRQDECYAVCKRTVLGLGIMLVSYSLYNDIGAGVLEPRVLVGHYEPVADVGGHSAMFYKSRSENSLNLVVDLGNKLNDIVLRKAIDVVYGTGALPKVLDTYINRDFVSKLETLSARAWDTSKPPSSGYTFTCKPDGERSWLVFYGWCWYMVSKQKPHRVRRWQASEDKFAEQQSTLVLDTEYVSGFGFVLIDCLTDSEGVPAPTTRNMEWVLRTFDKMLRTHTSCPVEVRRYFASFCDAREYAGTVPYAVDGVVAIRNGSTEVLKVKDIKSVELEHKGNGVMCAAEGTEVLTTSLADNTEPGTVVELRFSLDEKTRQYKLWDSFPRPDKKGNANGIGAVVNIFKSASTTETKEDDERRRSLLWCNRLRENIFGRCVNSADTRHIILDVGTGTGQSLGAMNKSESVSYILLEPDSKRCRMLQHRLGNVQIITEPSLIVPVIKQLKTRSKKWIIVNCTFSELWSAPSVLKKLAPELKCIQAVFSLQFIVEDLYDLFESHKLPIYGCCYTYDEKNECGTLLDACGVTMKVTGTNVATVKWGGDKTYEEPAVSVKDFYGLGTVVRGSDVVEMPEENGDGGCRSICSKVSVLLP